MVVAHLCPAIVRGQPQALPPTELWSPQRPMPGPPAFSAPAPSPDVFAEEFRPAGAWAQPWSWQCLPDGLLYKSYLAGGREPRLGNQWVFEKGAGWFWDATLGGRVGLVRYGTTEAFWPEGWQLDVEGAAFPRLDADRNLVSTDFRVGVPLTARQGPWEGKFGFYHLSSHLADEYMVIHHQFDRLNYVRDALVLGIGFRPVPDVRLYGETAYAFNNDGGSKPWEFQFGVELSPARPTGLWGAPFFAVNGRLLQEVNFGGNVTAEAGWQWRGQSGHLVRTGAYYFNGKGNQSQFFMDHEEQIGFGLWYDF